MEQAKKKEQIHICATWKASFAKNKDSDIDAPHDI